MRKKAQKVKFGTPKPTRFIKFPRNVVFWGIFYYNAGDDEEMK